jgi:hypothetical protein
MFQPVGGDFAMLRSAFVSWVFGGLLACAGALGAEDGPAGRSTASLLPDSVVLHAELTDLAGLVDSLQRHPLTRRAQQLEEYQRAIREPGYLMFRFVLKTVEDQLGMTWKQGLEELTQGGVSFSYDHRERGGLLLMRGKDAESVERILNTFLDLARGEAERRGDSDPIKEGEYRGLKVFQLGNARLARLDERLILTEQAKFGQAVLDRFLDGDDSSLESNPRWTAARSRLPAVPSGWVWIDMQQLRELGAASSLMPSKSNNPLAEFLLGGLSGTLRETPYVMGTLDFNSERLAISIKTPHRLDWVDEVRAYFVGPDGQSPAPPLLEPGETIFSLGAYRNISEMWLNSSELYDEQTDAGITQANANLSTLFGGKDFGESILGAFQPGFRAVAARQRFGNERPIPALKLPAFAIVLEFRDAQAAAPEFLRMYQNLIGFLNIVGAMNGNPQMEFLRETVDGNELLTARFLPGEQEDHAAAGVHFNFSPTIAVVDRQFVISSSRELAIELGGQLRRPLADNENRTTANTDVKIGFDALSEILNDNRGHLVLQNMLSEGLTREEAQHRIGLLLDGLSLLRDFRYRLEISDREAEIGLELRFRQN